MVIDVVLMRIVIIIIGFIITLSSIVDVIVIIILPIKRCQSAAIIIANIFNIYNYSLEFWAAAVFCVVGFVA